jgi:predicted nucleic acid-binding protein
LELAISAKADVLVSSDVHLLEMHPFRGVQILQLADFNQQILWEAVTERADRLT